MKKTKKSNPNNTQPTKTKEWGPIRITLISIAIALGLDFLCFMVSSHSDLFSALFQK